MFSKRDLIRKARFAFLIPKAGTREPYGLNFQRDIKIISFLLFLSSLTCVFPNLCNTDAIYINFPHCT